MINVANSSGGVAWMIAEPALCVPCAHYFATSPLQCTRLLFSVSTLPTFISCSGFHHQSVVLAPKPSCGSPSFLCTRPTTSGKWRSWPFPSRQFLYIALPVVGFWWFMTIMTMTMTMTLREVQHLSMEAWPYRRQCRGHDPAKKKLLH